MSIPYKNNANVLKRPLPPPLAYACLALSMSLVGSYVALSKPLAAVLPVLLLAWLRFGIGAVAMIGWLRKPADEPPLTPGVRRLLFLESFLGNFLFTLCMIYGVRLTSAVFAGVIMATIPAVVALMSWVFLHERIGLRTWGAVACGALGIGLLALSGNGHLSKDLVQAGGTSRAWLGNFLLLGAVACEAAYSIIGKRLTTALGPRRITAIINLWGFALSTPLGLYTAWRFDFGTVPAEMWLLLLFYGLAASVWTVWLWMTGLKSVPAATAGVFTVLLPVSTAVVGVTVLNERLDNVQAVALAIALAGILLATVPAKKFSSQQ